MSDYSLMDDYTRVGCVGGAENVSRVFIRYGVNIAILLVHPPAIDFYCQRH